VQQRPLVIVAIGEVRGKSRSGCVGAPLQHPGTWVALLKRTRRSLRHRVRSIRSCAITSRRSATRRPASKSVTGCLDSSRRSSRCFCVAVRAGMGPCAVSGGHGRVRAGGPRFPPPLPGGRARGAVAIIQRFGAALNLNVTSTRSCSMASLWAIVVGRCAAGPSRSGGDLRELRGRFVQQLKRIVRRVVRRGM
jgi:hypothetical protein